MGKACLYCNKWANTVLAGHGKFKVTTQEFISCIQIQIFMVYNPYKDNYTRDIFTLQTYNCNT